MSEESNIDIYRRRFLGNTATAAAGLAVAPGVMLTEVANARAADTPVSSDVRWGMLIDTNKCDNGCDDCVTACNEEHNLEGFGRPSTDAQWIRKVTLKDKQTGHVQSLPMLCQHCEHPPCVDVCPTGASFKRADGIVLVDKHICIGCRYCMMACPYKARYLIHEVVDEKLTRAPRGKGCVESCNLCVHRRDNGIESTACVDACAAEGHNAIVFGDLRDPESPLVKALAQLPSRQIREDLALNTGVRYSGV